MGGRMEVSKQTKEIRKQSQERKDGMKDVRK